jgi:integrase
MPKKPPPFLHREVTQYGRTCWYFRRGHGPRTRLPDESGSVEFWSAYEAAANGARPQRQGHARGSFAWALSLYRQSQAWRVLSPATQRQRTNIFKHVEKRVGGSRLKEWKRGDIVAGRDARSATPAQAVNFVKAMRGLFGWATEAGHVNENPCAGVKVKTVESEGFAPWTDADVDAYRKRWPLGTHQRLAFDVLRETGLRRGDAVRIGPAHVRDGVIRLSTEKTSTPVAVPVTDALADAIAAGPIGETFIVGARGQPIVKEAFTNMFRKWATAAGVNKSPHGVRKHAATADAHDGYSDAELSAKFGWEGRKMAALYTQAASRERLSLAAAARSKSRSESKPKG